MAKTEKLVSNPAAPRPQHHPNDTNDVAVSGPNFPEAVHSDPAGRASANSQPVVRLHKDSGIRMSPEEIVDVPPVYTDE